MKPVDLILLHPPTTFQNPTGLGLHNMIAASVPSTAVFEIYPLGFLSIGEYLERHGYHVAICNLALLNSIIPGLRPEAIIRRMRARVVGIDLHWAAHTSGVLELAHIIKNIYSDIKIVVGGLTASCFWREVLDYPEIDFVIRGDSAEYPFLCLLDTMKNGGKFEEVPNLSWRDNRGEIQTTGLDWVPENIDDYRTDYSWIIRSAARRQDPISLLMSIPYRDWIMNPSAAVITQRGCPNNCLLCGGSAYAYLNICNRKRPAIKSPAAVVRDVVSAARIMRGQIFLGSDMQDPGQDYYQEVFQRYRSLQIENPLTIEVIQPAPFEFYKSAVESCSSVTLHISADSHDETLRMQFGRRYTNDSLEQTIGAALDAGFKTVRIFFGIGLPGQNEGSVMETVNYCGELLDRFGHDGRFFPFISVLAPYIEPGSLAFDDPERYKYKNFYSTLRYGQNHSCRCNL
jgi:B12-binding domain/radical SAM domain protein